ncbi:MAG: DinB family protein [Gemmatimonadaceae bacterium]|nr:DinB family protein [Gemmatimonadaceae bacterium]
MSATHSSLAHLVPPSVSAYHRAEIAHGLRRVCANSELYWNAMPDEEFVAPFGVAWSPADHVRHLTGTVRAVSQGMRVPRLILRVVFGWSRVVSRPYDQLVSMYHARLQAGGQAGRFAPAPRSVVGDPAHYRRELLARHHAEVHALAARTMRWTRRQVDSVRLPHPLLGRLTVREMLLFTLYHNQHHVLVVARRRGEYFSDATPLNA